MGDRGRRPRPRVVLVCCQCDAKRDATLYAAARESERSLQGVRARKETPVALARGLGSNLEQLSVRGASTLNQ